MTQKRVLKSGMGCVLGFLMLLLLSAGHPIAAQDEPEPHTIHNACAGNCVTDTIFLHSGMGDTQAEYAYHGWFDSYYTLTGCGDPAWKTDILFLIDFIGDSVGAPGAPTMQCWQGLAAQGAQCSATCSDYFITDARYAPNVALSLDQSAAGYLEATLDNQSNLSKLPELQPNAYSRRFTLKTSLKYENGESLLVNQTPMPSLSYPNWITRGGYDNCIDQYGFDAPRCQIIANFATPSVVSTPVEFLDGTLYDLSSQVSDLSDANGSFSQQGYVRLLSDGDTITVAQGPYAGYALVKTHYLSSGRHSVELSSWDASTGPVTFTNHECNSWLSTCWITATHREADTYVYAVRGPADKVLEGSYTVEVVADVPHDKDFADNRVSYTYDASAAAGTTTDAGGQNPETDSQPSTVGDLRVIEIPGPGLYPATIGEDALGYLFRLAVPDGVSFMYLRLVSLDGGQYSAFVRRGSIPVPNYPNIADGYQCWAISDASYADGCSFSNPFPDDYYIFVHREQGGGLYRLEVEWTFPPPPPTVTPAMTATSIPAATPTAAPGQESDTEDTGAGVNAVEIEPNDSYAEANSWDRQGAFSGQLATSFDVDVLLLSFTEPGIYTFSLTDVGADLRIKMTLTRASSHNVVDNAKATAKGAPASLTFDASAGEQYYLLISAIAMSPATDQPYTLTLSGFIPDPDEPNDSPDSATLWDLTAGPVNGYFWDKTTGRYDYFTFHTSPALSASAITFTLTNPAPDLRVRLTLLRANGQVIANSPYSAPGQPVTLAVTLDAGTQYTLKLESQFDRTSLLPYTLSAQVTALPDSPTPTPGGQSGQTGGK